MTDNEIIKALECCQRREGCLDCHFLDSRDPAGECIAKLSRVTVDLITRQKDEIESIKNAFENSQKTSKYWKSKCDELTEEALTTKSEAIRELARRLIEEIDAINYKEYNNYLDTIDIIERVAEEMECETDEMQNNNA